MRTRKEYIEILTSEYNQQMKKLISLIAGVAMAFSAHAQDSTANVSMSADTITISFTGDCTLGEYKGQGAGNQFKDYYNSKGPDYFFANVKHIFEQDDITFINLEGPLTDHKQVAQKTFPIKGDVRNINCLTNSSIEMCNIANNHTLDCGEKGVQQTKQLLDSVKIGVCGYDNIGIVDVHGTKVAFLGYNCLRGYLTKKVSADIIDAKSKADIVIVQFHWGEESKNFPNPQQKAMGHAAIDAGADFVVGNHPHVMQGIETYKGKTILYSLGNFCFGANKNSRDKDTFIYVQKFVVSADGNISYGPSDIIPCRISSVTTSNNFQPTPLQGAGYDRVISRLKSYKQ